MRAWGALLVLCALGCGRGDPQAVTCPSGTTRACLCDGGGRGVQACQRDGTYGTCACFGAAPIALRVDDLVRPPPVVLSPPTPEPRRVTTTPPTPVAPPPTTIPRLDPAVSASPMDQARACLRSSPDIHAGNQCVVSVLRGRANTESEVGLLCVVYRSMARTSDAVRCMRNYIQRFPNGARVRSFQQYVDGNSP